MNSFFAYIARTKYIARWALMRNTTTENIAEHSMMTAAIAHCLALIANKRFGLQLNAEAIAVKALYHDCSEVITGDMPTPVKYNNEDINKAYKTLELAAENSLLLTLPEDLRADYEQSFRLENGTREQQIVKAADKLSAFAKCEEELSSGNKEFLPARDATLKSIKAMGLPEVDAFLDMFGDSFGKTLDEL